MNNIQTTIDLILDGVAEVRALGLHGKGPWEGFAKGVISGYFDNHQKMIEAITKLDKQHGATGIYITLNPVHQDMIALAQNRLKSAIKTTEDANVLRYRWLPIDIDPVRITGISSSDDELHKAFLVMTQVNEILAQHGIESTITAHSGNGYHLLVAWDEPNTTATTHLIKDFLTTLSQMFNTDSVKIDTVNSNPARIWKCYGTMSRKGDNTESRPHRRSEIIEARDRIVVSRDTISSFVQSYFVPEPEPEKKSYNGTKFDLKGFLIDKGVEIIKEKQHGSSTLYCLKHCVFNSDHENNEAAFGQATDGTVFYQCFHNSCQDKTWHDAKQVLGWNFESNRKHLKANESNCKQKKANETSRKSTESKEEANDIKKPVANLVREYVEQATGIFTTYDIDSELCLYSRSEKNARSLELNRLKKQGVIKQVTDKRGTWRIIDGNLTPMNLHSAKPEPLPIALPLGIHKLVNIYPSNIIVVAGSPNAGKSAFVSSLIRECNILNTNIAAFESRSSFEQMARLICPGKHRPDVHFFSSEAGAGEMASRLKEFPGGLDDFKGVNFWERDRNFADVIDPCGVNVIDYMEVYDNFYEIGSWINDIHRELKTGIAVIVIQKKRGAEVGKGGDVTLEKPRLYLSLENNAPYGGICKIIKAKFPKNPKFNPNGKEIDYRLSHGCMFTNISDWRFVEGEKRRQEINRQYAQKLSSGEYLFNFKLIDGQIAGLKTEDCYQWQQKYENVNVGDFLDRVERDSKRKPFMNKKNWFFMLSGMLEKENKLAVASS